MATAASVVSMSVEEYLRTCFEPDAEYVDGFIEERNLGTFDHARLQGFLYAMILSKEAVWEVYVSPELRVRVGATRFRIPDVCVVDARGPVEQIPTERAPLLCVEVLSPEDRLPRVLKRVEDFHRMGVAVVWVFDPAEEKVWVSRAGGVEEWIGGVLRVEGTKVELDPAEAFQKLRARR